MHLQKLILTLVKQGQNFDLFDKTKKSINLKLIKKKCQLPTQFCLRSISERFCSVDSRKISFKGNVYDFRLIANLAY